MAVRLPRPSHSKNIHWTLRLNHAGQVFADGNYYVSIGRGIDFTTNAAQKVASQAFPGINIENGQFIARHQQHFGTDSNVKGIFSLTLHFQCMQSPNAGYHFVCFAIPKNVMDKHESVQQLWNGIKNATRIPGRLSLYNVTHGHWDLIEEQQTLNLKSRIVKPKSIRHAHQ